MEKTINCKKCGNQISKQAVICPSCGVKVKKPIYKKIWFWGLLIIIVIGIGSSAGGNYSSTTNNETSEITNDANSSENTKNPTSKEKKNSPKITMAEFEALQTGITYEQAVEIIGGAGEVMSQVDMAGYNTVMYMWQGDGGLGSNANATFQNNSLISKAQIGLK